MKTSSFRLRLRLLFAAALLVMSASPSAQSFAGGSQSETIIHLKGAVPNTTYIFATSLQSQSLYLARSNGIAVGPRKVKIATIKYFANGSSYRIVASSVHKGYLEHVMSTTGYGEKIRISYQMALQEHNTLGYTCDNANYQSLASGSFVFPPGSTPAGVQNEVIKDVCIWYDAESAKYTYSDNTPRGSGKWGNQSRLPSGDYDDTVTLTIVSED